MHTHDSIPEIFQTVRAFADQHVLLVPSDRIIVGLSGGPDSVFLLHVLIALRSYYNLTIIAAHLDHGWRENSHTDEQFCKELAQQLDIPYVSAHARDSIHIKTNSGSREDLGRRLRRAFLERVAHDHNANKIALAHHADDTIETFFIRLLRGAGLSGLASMRPRAGLYIRPLLNLFKSQILDYLSTHAIAYLTDYTNIHDTYLRNRIRNYVIPALKKTDDRFEHSCIRTIEHLQEADDFLGQLAQSTLAKISSTHNNLVTVDLTQLRSLDTFLQKTVILHWLVQERVPFTPTQSFFDEIIRFLHSTTGGQHDLSNSWAIVKKEQRAYIKKLD